jgi:hypothetical protein
MGFTALLPFCANDVVECAASAKQMISVIFIICMIAVFLEKNLVRHR